MLEISEKLILEQSDAIFGVSQISWENYPWKQLSLVNDEEVISLSHAKVYVFSDSVLCLGKMNQNPTSNSAWEDKLTWLKSLSKYRTLDTIDGQNMSMFSDIMWRIKDNEKECIANSTLVSLFAKRFPLTWIRNKVVFYLQRKTRRRMGQSR